MYMLPEDFASLNLACYELNLLAGEPCSLPAFLGSTLRGAFGHALKETVCIMPHRDCTRCMVADRCTYTYLFETQPPSDAEQLSGQQQVPHPYILTPPYSTRPIQRVWKIPSRQGENKPVAVREAALEPASTLFPLQERRNYRIGDQLTFQLLLMGRANESLPYVVYAISEMGRRGLGVSRTPFHLNDGATIDGKGNKIRFYDHESQRLISKLCSNRNLSEFIQSRLAELEPLRKGSIVKLRFLTPTRIRIKGDIQTELTFGLLVRNLLRRISMLAVVHGNGKMNVDYRALIEKAENMQTLSASLKWQDWERYSNRQKAKMNLGGFIGEIEFAGEEIMEFLPLLVAGEFLHIGAGTTFGLGKFELGNQP
jgi:hypothetical protein